MCFQSVHVALCGISSFLPLVNIPQFMYCSVHEPLDWSPFFETIYFPKHLLMHSWSSRLLSWISVSKTPRSQSRANVKIAPNCFPELLPIYTSTCSIKDYYGYISLSTFGVCRFLNLYQSVCVCVCMYVC